MFARMRIAAAVIAATAVVLSPGCQDPDGPSQTGPGQQRRPASPADRSSRDLAAEEAPGPRIEAGTYIAAGRLHESQGRLLMAIQQYEFARRENAGDAELLNRLGVLYDRVGNGAEAEKAYTEAIRINPNDARLHNNLAFSYIMRKRWREAEVELTRAIELAPEFARARVNLGTALAQQDRFDEALKQFQIVLPLEDAWYNVGLMYQSRRRPVEAASAYKKAIQLNAGLVAARDQLARMPSAVLGQADQKLTAEQEAEAEIAQEAEPPALVPDNAPPAEGQAEASTPLQATQPAEAQAEVPAPPQATQPADAPEQVAHVRPDDMSEAQGMSCADDPEYAEYPDAAEHFDSAEYSDSVEPLDSAEHLDCLEGVTWIDDLNCVEALNAGVDVDGFADAASTATPVATGKQEDEFTGALTPAPTSVPLLTEEAALAPAPVSEPTSQPAGPASPAAAAPARLPAAVMSELDALLPPWYRSPELADELAAGNPCVSLDDQASWLIWVSGADWLVRQDSPLPPAESTPLPSETAPAAAPSTQPN
ncbi:MAG: tetratricopeptide repeat protein [Planctomycetes bacterium]|nr:tetratricopeptide repeat protein [Planctomycetota bacterium]